jgi:hypothetical protein
MNVIVAQEAAREAKRGLIRLAAQELGWPEEALAVALE